MTVTDTKGGPPHRCVQCPERGPGRLRERRQGLAGDQERPDPRQGVQKEIADGLLWPEPWLALNPAFESSGTVSDLLAKSVLHPEAVNIFRARKDEGLSVCASACDWAPGTQRPGRSGDVTVVGRVVPVSGVCLADDTRLLGIGKIYAVAPHVDSILQVVQL